MALWLLFSYTLMIEGKIIYLHTNSLSQNSSDDKHKEITKEIWQLATANIVKNFTETESFLNALNDIIKYSFYIKRTTDEILEFIYISMETFLEQLSSNSIKHPSLDSVFVRMLGLSIKLFEETNSVSLVSGHEIRNWHNNSITNKIAYLICMVCESVLVEGLLFHGLLLIDISPTPVNAFLTKKFINYLDIKYQIALQVLIPEIEIMTKHFNMYELILDRQKPQELIQFIKNTYTENDIVICNLDLSDIFTNIIHVFTYNQLKCQEQMAAPAQLRKALQNIQNPIHSQNAAHFKAILKSILKTEVILTYRRYHFGHFLTSCAEKLDNFIDLIVPCHETTLELYRLAFIGDN